VALRIGSAWNTEAIRKWNRLKSNKVSRGMVLRIYKPRGRSGSDLGPGAIEVQKEINRNHRRAVQAQALWSQTRPNSIIMNILCGSPTLPMLYGRAVPAADGVNAFAGSPQKDAVCLTTFRRVR